MVVTVKGCHSSTQVRKNYVRPIAVYIFLGYINCKTTAGAPMYTHNYVLLPITTGFYCLHASQENQSACSCGEYVLLYLPNFVILH